MIARLETQRVILPHRSKRIRFSFPNPPHAGRTLVRLRDAAFGYGARDVFAGAGLELARDDKVAIVGANGAGKTTLLRVLAGQLEPRSGARETFPHTRLGYFAQHAAETLDPAHNVLEALEEIAPAEWRPRLRSLLGNFLFSGDDVQKPCRVLSGGERQRVALARILLEPANLLLLDEPTHHLDLAGKEVLEEALEQYPGAIVVVTHDRSLMARLATRVIEVTDGRVRLYPGGYDDYEQARLARAAGAAAQAPAEPRGRSGERPAPATQGPRAERSARKPPSPPGGAGAREHRATATSRAARATEQQRAKELKRVERDIETREARVKALEAQLADPEVYHDGARAKELVAEYERLRSELESLWQRMAEL
jgi:ATP-binding cassette subfamily F protein 3